jgi:hypothetical protein
MNNRDLLMENSTDLRAGLYECLDFILFPESLYKTFESIFGGGPSICRKVIIKAGSDRRMIELYPVKDDTSENEGKGSSDGSDDVTSDNETLAVNEWKYHFKVGDMVDAADDLGDWYESEIKVVDIHTR